jgi:hypothetical protein
VQLVPATQRLDDDLVAVDPPEGLERGIQRRSYFVSQPAQALEYLIADHPQDQHPAEALN